jgi:hypothetical protein
MDPARWEGRREDKLFAAPPLGNVSHVDTFFFDSRSDRHVLFSGVVGCVAFDGAFSPSGAGERDGHCWSEGGEIPLRKVFYRLECIAGRWVSM